MDDLPISSTKEAVGLAPAPPRYRPYFAHQVIEDMGRVLEQRGLIDGLIAVEAPVVLNRFPRVRWILTPLLFLCRVASLPGRGPILVRDFNNLQILLAWPALWLFRKRLFWINNHNVQLARSKPFVAWLMRRALATGFNLVLMESRRGAEPIWTSAHEPIVLPYLIRNGRVPERIGKTLRVGFVGRFREDKAQEEALKLLIANPLPASELVVANPDAGERAKYAALGCRVLDTSSREQFRAALAEIDVAVVNYRREAYEYRPSGIVRDLVEAGVAVVCPNFPVLADQIATPAATGRVFDRLSDLPQAIESLRDSAREEGFAEYFSYRSPDSIARLFQHQIEGRRQ